MYYYYYYNMVCWIGGGGGGSLPFISGLQWLRTLSWNISRTWASCDADRGRGLRDGMGRRSAELVVLVLLGPAPDGDD